jgi:hypothetical protein
LRPAVLFCAAIAAHWREIAANGTNSRDNALSTSKASAKTPIMTNALTALDKGKPRAEPLMVAIAAVAIGMFVGTWIVGPMVSSGPMSKERETETPLSYEQMIARPDPFPYRTPTPVVEQAPTSYAAAARQRAQSEHGERYAEDSEAPDPWQERRSRWRASVPDRHAVH